MAAGTGWDIYSSSLGFLRCRRRASRPFPAGGATTIVTLSFKRKRKMFSFLSFRWWKERQFVQSAEDAVTRTIHMVCLDRSIHRSADQTCMDDYWRWYTHADALAHMTYGHVYKCTCICMVLESGECRAWPPYCQYACTLKCFLSVSNYKSF